MLICLSLFLLLISLSNSLPSPPLLPIPRLLPIRYDVQLQLPTASDLDPLVPTFFGSAKIDFQLTRSLSSSSDPFDLDSSIRLTFLAQQLDQFVNVSLVQSGKEGADEWPQFQIQVVVRPPREVDFIIKNWNGSIPAGRYTLEIGRFQGIISYGKGLFYRDAGGLPLLGTDFFLDNAPMLFPQLGGPLQKTTTKLSLIHPQGSIALSSMQPLGPTESLNEHWRLTRFMQAPNVASFMLAIALFPDSVYERTLVLGQPPLFIWTNRLLHRPTLKSEMARLAGPIFEIVSSLVGAEQLPLNTLNLVVVDEFNGTQSFGLIFLPLAKWDAADRAHRIAILARQFIRQWIGGMTTVASINIFCLQEDLVEWLAQKVVKMMLKEEGKKEWERFELAQYLRIQLAETFLSPGESVALAEWAGENEINSHCGLKGIQMLNSLEMLTNERTLLDILHRLLIQQRYRNFHFDHFRDLLRPILLDNIDLGQVFDFWFKNGGIPNLLVEKSGERMRLMQMNEGRQAQIGDGQWAKMPLWPLAISIRNVTLPFKFMLSQSLNWPLWIQKCCHWPMLDLVGSFNPIPKISDQHSEEHLYRVNYDWQNWERILRELDATTFSALTARSRAQLLGDFCYFNAVDQIGPNGDRLQRWFLSILQENYEHFELCEFYAFWCMGARGRRIPMDREAREKYAEIIWQKVWPALQNGATNYECGGPGAGFDAGNELCRLAFDRNCF